MHPAPTSPHTDTQEAPSTARPSWCQEKAPTGSSLRFLFLLHVQEDNAEHEEADHHGEGASIVGICRGDEPLVLCVLEGTHRHLAGERAALAVQQPEVAFPERGWDSLAHAYLCGGVEMGVSQTVVIHFELEHAVDIRQLELHTVFAT